MSRPPGYNANPANRVGVFQCIGFSIWNTYIDNIINQWFNFYSVDKSCEFSHR